MNEQRVEPGELVYLLAEVRAGDRIHEIGTSARVVSAGAVTVTLRSGGTSIDVFACPREKVSSAATRANARRSRAAFRPVTA